MPPQVRRRRRRRAKDPRVLTLTGVPVEVLVKIAAWSNVVARSRWRVCCRKTREAVSLSTHSIFAPELHHGRLGASCVEIRPSGSSKDEEQQWSHGHNYRCQGCGTGGDLILCDFCNVVYHLDCLTPPLLEAPEGPWRCPQCESERSAPLIGAVAAFPRGQRGRFSCVGGYRLSSFTPNASDLYECEWTRCGAEWDRVLGSGFAPPEFCASSALFDEADLCMRVFAQSSPLAPSRTRRRRNKVASSFEEVFTLKNNEWSRIATLGEAPSERTDAALCDDGDRLVVFGGFSVKSNRHLDGLFQLSKIDWTWRVLAPDTPPPSSVQIEEEDSVEPPRTEEEETVENHTRTRNEYTLAFGLRKSVSLGRRYEGEVSRTTQKKVPIRRWRRRTPEAWTGRPKPRAGHTLTRIGQRFWLFGGLGPSNHHDDLWTLDENDSWNLESCSGAKPRGRAAHSAVALGPHLIIFGGLNGSRFLNDLFILHTPTRCWSTPLVPNNGTTATPILPSPRMRPALVKVEDRRPADPHILIFGGTRAWGSANRDVSTARHDGDLHALTFFSA